MRIFKTDDNETMIYHDSEIEMVQSCCGYTTAGSSGRTNCESEGCYSLDNSASECFADLCVAISEKFKVDTRDLYETGDVDELFENSEKILEFISDWRAANEDHTAREVIEFDNSPAIFVDAWEEITDRYILKAFETKEFVKDTGSEIIYESGNYVFTSSRFLSDCAGYTVSEKED